MPRASFSDTIASIAADGTLKAIGNVQVEVRAVSDNSLETLWDDRTDTSPGAQIGTSLITGDDGLVRFYAEGGEYNITYTDLSGTNRIESPQSFGWDAVPGSQNPEALGFAMGDIKISSIDDDHGRWLRLDGRELTQAEVESALSLSAGQAAAFVSYMGTGSGSKYGAAASSKVKLPDARRRHWIGAGTSADTSPTPPAGTTARPLGNAGGAETVTLSAAESGLPTHTHTQPAHSHAATQPAHSHTGTTAANGEHAHGVDFDSLANTAGTGTGIRVTNIVSPGSGQQSTATSDEPDHTHTFTTSSATPAITVPNATPLINSVAAAAASSAHNNMGPFVAVGYLFIKV